MRTHLFFCPGAQASPPANLFNTYEVSKGQDMGYLGVHFLV